MKGSVFQIERRLPCGSWARVQRIDPQKLDRADIPRNVKEPRRINGAINEAKIVEDYAHLVFARWVSARPRAEQRLVKIGD